MRPAITQEDDMGCGAACVAFAVSISYIRATEVLGSDKATTVGYTLKELVDGLSECGVLCFSKHINQVAKHYIHKQGTIVFIKRSNRYPDGHYLIRYGCLWMDPWINSSSDNKIENAQSGYRKRLPGQAQWAVFQAGS